MAEPYHPSGTLREDGPQCCCAMSVDAKHGAIMTQTAAAMDCHHRQHLWRWKTSMSCNTSGQRGCSVHLLEVQHGVRHKGPYRCVPRERCREWVQACAGEAAGCVAAVAFTGRGGTGPGPIAIACAMPAVGSTLLAACCSARGGMQVTGLGTHAIHGVAGPIGMAVAAGVPRLR